MSFTYFLCGLRLRSSFPLAGAREAGLDDGEEVSLRLVPSSRLRSAWTGAVGGAWRGSLRDGEELRIERGRGDLLVSYGERARFHLDARRSQLLCSAEEVADLGWQRVLLTRVLPLVAIARGREALHAGAVHTAAGAVAIAGPSGAGKSTLTAELVRRGHPLLADDVLVLESDRGRVLAHPAGPQLSLCGGDAIAGTALGELGGKHWIAVENVATAASELAAVVLLERGRGEQAATSRAAASPLALAPHMLGLPDDEGRDRDRFNLYSDLVQRTPILRLTAAEAVPPPALAAEIERAVGLAVPDLAGSPA